MPSNSMEQVVSIGRLERWLPHTRDLTTLNRSWDLKRDALATFKEDFVQATNLTALSGAVNLRKSVGSTGFPDALSSIRGAGKLVNEKTIRFCDVSLAALVY